MTQVEFTFTLPITLPLPSAAPPFADRATLAKVWLHIFHESFVVCGKCLPTIFHTIKNWRQIMAHLIPPHLCHTPTPLPPFPKLGQLQTFTPQTITKKTIKKNLIKKRLMQKNSACWACANFIIQIKFQLIWPAHTISIFHFLSFSHFAPPENVVANRVQIVCQVIH